MAKTNLSGSVDNSGFEDKTEIKNDLKKAAADSAAKEAEKKEEQPENTDDLSQLHNTHEVGTSGGDQRASDSDPDELKNQKLQNTQRQ